MRSSDVTASMANRWVTAWTGGRLAEVAAMLAAEVTVEHNLELPAERTRFIDSIRCLANAIEEAPVLSLTTTESRAALLYDCRVPRSVGGIRLAEFLTIEADRIVGVRRIYDLTAVDRLLPALHAPATS
jgi:hypothetical protein